MAPMRFNRPVLSPEDVPFLRDAAACRVWLSKLGKFDSTASLEQIGDFLHTPADVNVPPARRYDILEVLRVALGAALRDAIHDGDFRAVPLVTADASRLWHLVDVVEDLRDAFQDLIQSLPQAGAEGAGPARMAALHRAIDLHGMIVILHLRAHVAVPDSLWESLCRLGQLVRELDGQDVAVADAARVTGSDNSREAFVVPVLLALADPGALPLSEFDAVRAVARMLAAKVGFRIDAASTATPTPSRPTINPGPTLRLASFQVRLDTQRLMESLERRIAALAQGKSPAQIGLGESIGATAARLQMQRLQRLWGPVSPDSIDSPEHVWRKPSVPAVLAIIGLAGAEAGTSKGAAPKAPKLAPGVNPYSYQLPKDDRVTHAGEVVEKDPLADLLVAAESWNLVGETVDTLHCARRHPRPRLSLNQLIGVKPGGIDSNVPFVLGLVQALQQSVHEDEEGRLRPASTHLLRIKLLSGLPVALKASLDGVELDIAYLLASVRPGIKPDISTDGLFERVRQAPDVWSVVVPLASFRPQREMRVVAGGKAALLSFEELLMRGLDFDLIRFSIKP